MNKIESFFEQCDNEFWAYLENTIYRIGKEDDEYESVCEEIEDTLDQYPKLRDLFENDIPTNLDIKDSKALMKLKTLYMEKNIIDMKNLFYLGGRNMYYYLSKIRVIDEEGKLN